MKLLPVLLLCSAAALAHEPDPDHPGPFHKWFEEQKVPDGTNRSCCAEADGHVLTEDDWRISVGEYQVHIGDDWVTFPNTGHGNAGNTILGQTGNPTGGPVAWWLGSGASATPRCFAPGTVS
jgi:hypothetical protein